MSDNLYKYFRDPTKKFKKEPRAFCYDLAKDLIEKAQEEEKTNWYTHTNTIDAILLLLFCWNFASPITKGLTRKQILRLLSRNQENLKKLEKNTILDFDCKKGLIEAIYQNFRNELGQTGASKALSLLNPELFVMWDTKIRERLRKVLIKGISNGEKSRHYIKFLIGIKGIIKEYSLEKKIRTGSTLAKKIDEYNYVKIIMEKDC